MFPARSPKTPSTGADLWVQGTKRKIAGEEESRNGDLVVIVKSWYFGQSGIQRESWETVDNGTRCFQVLDE